MLTTRLSAALFAAPLLLMPAAAVASAWTVDPDTSRLGFEVAQGENLVSGQFTDWTAAIEFDPDAPEAAEISATIQTATTATGIGQLDGMLPGDQWFAAGQFPVAEFTSTDVRLVDGTTYAADGTVTIRGISQPVTLTFTLEIDGDTAQAKGTATLDRTVFGVGEGVGLDQVAAAVTVTFDLTANR